MKKKSGDGFAAPIVIVAIIVLIDIAVVVVGIMMVRAVFPDHIGIGTFLVIFVTVMLSSVLAIYVLRARVKEIKSERADDLSKY